MVKRHRKSGKKGRVRAHASDCCSNGRAPREGVEEERQSLIREGRAGGRARQAARSAGGEKWNEVKKRIMAVDW